MATPLHPIGLTMHASYALLFTPSGQQGPAAGWFVFQLAAVFAIIYFMILRPQKKQRERHNQLLASLQKGDKVLTSGGWWTTSSTPCARPKAWGSPRTRWASRGELRSSTWARSSRHRSCWSTP